MVKIISPFSGTDPIATMFSRLGGHLAGQRASALEVEKAREAQRKNVEMEGLAADIAAGRIDPKDPRLAARLLLSGEDPSQYAVLGGMTVDPHSDMATRMLATRGLYDKSANIIDQNIQIAKDQEAAKLGVTQADNAQQSMDRRYATDTGAKTTRDDAALAQQNEMLKFAQTPRDVMLQGPSSPPVMGPGGAPIAAGAPGEAHPAIVPQGELFTRPDIAGPIPSEAEAKGVYLQNHLGDMGAVPPAEQRMFNADAGAGQRATPGSNWAADDGRWFNTHDGVTDSATGAPLPRKPDGSMAGHLASVAGSVDQVSGNTNSTQSQLQQQRIAHVQFKGLLDSVRQQVMASPDQNFGLPAILKGYAQDIGQVTHGLTQGLGFSMPEQAVSAILNGQSLNGVANNVSPEVRQSLFAFDPRLGKMSVTYGLLLYSAASALYGQTNRSVSDQDIKNIRDSIGDPVGIFSSKPLMLAKLDALAAENDRQTSVVDQMLGGGVAPAGPAAAAPAQAAPAVPAAPAAAPTMFNTPDEITAAKAKGLVKTGDIVDTPRGKMKVK